MTHKILLSHNFKTFNDSRRTLDYTTKKPNGFSILSASLKVFTGILTTPFKPAKLDAGMSPQEFLERVKYEQERTNKAN